MAVQELAGHHGPRDDAALHAPESGSTRPEIKMKRTKVQRLGSLRAEMKAVARGRRPAPPTVSIRGLSSRSILTLIAIDFAWRKRCPQAQPPCEYLGCAAGFQENRNVHKRVLRRSHDGRLEQIGVAPARLRMDLESGIE